MSDRIVLRKVYAIDSNTGLFPSTGQVLVTDGGGGTNWLSILSSLTIYGGDVVGNLPSTISTFSTQVYLNTQYFQGLSSLSTDFYNYLGSGDAPTVGTAQLTSTVAGLSQSGYVSSSQLQSSIIGTSESGAISPSTLSTITANLSTASFVSTIENLGTIGYISSLTFISAINNLGQIYVSVPSLTSTVGGLGQIYISTSALVSTTEGITLNLAPILDSRSTVQGLGSSGYVSTLSLNSTVRGLGSSGYVSTSALVSTVASLEVMKSNIRFDNTTNISVYDSINTFTNVANVIYVSTFFQSSIYFEGNQGVAFQSPCNVAAPTALDMRFSTASINLSPFSSFINSNSRITLDIFPNIAFMKLGTGATAVPVLPISSLLQYDTNYLYRTAVTSYIYPANTRVARENGSYIDASNFYTTPIRIYIPPGIVNGNYDYNYSLIHYMPSSLNDGAYQNALHSNTVTPFFGSTGSIFVSVQNIV